jgi:hypothetical protein
LFENLYQQKKNFFFPPPVQPLFDLTLFLQMIALFLLFSLALGQTGILGAYNAGVSACVGANNVAVQGGLCYRLRYPVLKSFD